MRDQGGKFQPGRSGNPGGRPKSVGPVKELAASYTEDAIRALAGIMEDETAPASARAAAAVALLDRAHGRPGQDLSMKIDGADIATSHLAAIREMALRRKPQPVEDDTPTSTH